MEPSAETSLDTFAVEPPTATEPPVESPAAAPVESPPPEPEFAARRPPPEAARAFPSLRRAVFFDVENASRAEHVGRLLEHLQLDRVARATELVAVGNWRVINHDTARLLAGRGANLVHSAPSTGVRDWSDLRIAVSAGVWLGSVARPGDVIEIVSDDQAFDAVGDVARSLGVEFHRISGRALGGERAETAREEAPEPRSRRRRRGGRRARSEPVAAVVAVASGNGMPADPSEEGHTAPHDELLAVARELLARAPQAMVSIDALSNALKAHGFRRPPGSPRLITRLRRIKELAVGRNGSIRLADGEPPDGVVAPVPVDESASPTAAESVTTETAPVANSPTRRRRRRGGRRRRGRGGGKPAAASP